MRAGLAGQPHRNAWPGCRTGGGVLRNRTRDDRHAVLRVASRRGPVEARNGRRPGTARERPGGIRRPPSAGAVPCSRTQARPRIIKVFLDSFSEVELSGLLAATVLLVRPCSAAARKTSGASTSAPAPHAWACLGVSSTVTAAGRCRGTSHGASGDRGAARHGPAHQPPPQPAVAAPRDEIRPARPVSHPTGRTQVQPAWMAR